ncbi:hypothetical protein ACWGI9_39665 [Streptomyces sp. NPDC054833]
MDTALAAHCTDITEARTERGQEPGYRLYTASWAPTIPPPSRTPAARPDRDRQSSFEDSPACRCAAPPARERGFARRLRAGTAHPHLAVELATAWFTAASTSRLATARVQDAALDGSTVTLHDRHNVRQGCMTHPVPTWARPLLRAAAFTHLLATGTSSGKLFTDPYEGAGLPRLTDFAEALKLRPPQPPRPKRRKSTRKRPLPPTVWPLSNAHHHLPWTMPEDMQGCPQPPGYKPRRTPYSTR